MEILCYDKVISKELYNSFLANNLIYGNETDFGSLITPSSTLLEKNEVKEIGSDLAVLWELYRIWNKLYQHSLVNEAPSWIKEYSEHSMGDEEVLISRMFSSAELEPSLCRVDYVCLGTKRCIAEVQWRFGGPGLFFGMQDVYSNVLPAASGEEALGSTIKGLHDVIGQFIGDHDAVAVNLVRGVWLNGESYLEKAYKNMGLRYIPITIEEAGSRIVNRDGDFFAIDEEGKSHKIGFLNGHSFIRFFPKKELVELAKSALDARIWIETPLNYIYRQKWGLALPFMEEYKKLFSNRIREIVIPTALLNGRKPDLSPIVPYVKHPQVDKLLHIESLMDLAELPTSLRKVLVLKCGSGTGEFYIDGKGVFRLTGSREYVRKTLEFIKHRVDCNEPWIIQPYIDEKYEIPVSLPWALDSSTLINAHARVMIFGSRCGNNQPAIIGGLGNYGEYWKVSGRTPCMSEQGSIGGTAFNDIRVTYN